MKLPMRSNLPFRDPVFSTRVAIIMRKFFLHANKIDLEIMWSHALGSSSTYDGKLVLAEIKQNNGIWAPDSGSCKPAKEKITSTCDLPSGSDYYSWGQREKGTCQIVDNLSFLFPELYRVAHYIVPKVLLTSKQELHFSILSFY